MKFTLGLKGLPFEFDPKQIIYVENEYDVVVNDFILRRLDYICEYFKSEGYEFIYMPRLTSKYNEFVCNYYVFKYDLASVDLFDSDFLLNYMAHPENRNNIPPSLVYYSKWATTKYGEDIAIRGITIDDVHSHEFDFADILSEIKIDRNGPEIDIRFSYGEPNPGDIEGYERVDIESVDSFTAPDPIPYLEEQFDEETQKLYYEVKEQINVLKQRGVALYVLEEMLRGPIKPSRMVITADYRIFLPEYNRLAEIVMTPLVKAVYFLFLRHPEGIPFKHLTDYYDELLKIYIEIKGGWVNEEMKKSVMYATNPYNNSINEKCARIREAFISKFDERIIEPYIVRGKRGCPKTITLPRELVEWQKG